LKQNQIEVPFVALFIHRVMDMKSGRYVLIRDPARTTELLNHVVLQATHQIEQITDHLYFIEDMNVETMAQRVSCDQEIAGESFFTIGCFGDFTDFTDFTELVKQEEEEGKGKGKGKLALIDGHRYRRAFWEAGIIGHLLYLDATALGYGATGIGCHEDEPMRQYFVKKEKVQFSPLYHVAVGSPLKDRRIVNLPPYNR